MALIKCAECNNEVSDRAATCPRCGAPVTGASQGTMRDVHTGRLASLGKRLGGSLIDVLITMVIVGPIMFATGVMQGIFSGRSMTIGAQVGFFVVGWVIFLLVNGSLLSRKGQTVGKYVVKTRIVDLDGRVPDFGKLLLLRYLALSLVTQIPVVGAIAGLVDALFIFGKDRRCLHDYMAGTRVIEA